MRRDCVEGNDEEGEATRGRDQRARMMTGGEVGENKTGSGVVELEWVVEA